MLAQHTLQQLAGRRAREGLHKIVAARSLVGGELRLQPRSQLSRERRGRGYAPLGETAWISPRASVELDALLDAEQLRAERFFAAYDGDARGLLARAWDLDRLARAYQRWLAMAGELIAGAGPDATDETVFAQRSTLVHEWRKFLFSDPGLPAALLPAEWPGHEAARVFQAESARLLPGASRFVDCCLESVSKLGEQP